MKAIRKPISKKLLVMILFVLAVIICGIVLIKTASIYNRLTKNIESLGIYSASMVPYTTDYPLIENLTDQDFIDHVSRYLKEASFRGLISESNIIRTSEKRYVRLLLVAADNRCYEIQLTDQKDNQCYIRPMTGWYFENSYIKIGNCQDLYSYVWNYIKAKVAAEDAQQPSGPSAEAAEMVSWQQAYLDCFTDTILPTQAEAHPGQPIYGVSLMDINFDGVPELMVWDWVASGAATGMLYKIDRSNVVPVSERVFSTNIVKGHLSEQPWPLEDLRAFLLVRAHGNGVYYWAVHDGNGQDDRAWGKYLILDAAGAEIASYDSTSKEDRTTAWNIFRAQYEVMDIDYSDFTLSVYTDGEIDAAAFSALMDRWQPVQVDLQAMSGMRPAYTAVSGGMSVPLTPIAQAETAADIPVEKLSWLPIVFDEFGQPFEILQEGEATICNYLIHDAETGEALDYFRPSGLSPQTYVFQNAVPGRRYLITVGPVKEFGNYVFGAIYSGHVTDATPRVHATVPTFRNAEGTELYLNMPLMELNARLDTMLKYGQTYVLPQHALGVAAVLKTEESGMSWPVVQLGFSEGWAPSEGPGIGATTEEVRAYWGEPDVAAEPVNERTPTVNYLLYEFPAGTIEFTHRGDGIITQINLYARDDSLSDGGISGGSVTYLHGRESSHIEHFSCFGELFIMCMSTNDVPYRMAVTEADGTVTVLAEGKDTFQGTMPAPRIENGTLDVEVGGAWILVVNWSKPEFHE